MSSLTKCTMNMDKTHTHTHTTTVIFVYNYLKNDCPLTTQTKPSNIDLPEQVTAIHRHTMLTWYPETPMIGIAADVQGVIR